jgi:predicted PurR-regulated permease PerM
MISSRAIAKVILVSAAVLLGLYLLYLIRQILGMLFISMFLAVALGPAVDFFHRGRVPRWGAIVLVYLSIALAVFGVGLLIVPPIVSQVDKFTSDVPGYVKDLNKSKTIRKYDEKYHVTKKLEKEAQKLPTRLGDAVGALRSVTVGVFSAIFQLVTVLVLTFFLLLDGRAMLDFLFARLGPERERRARTVAGDVYKAVGGYVLGNFGISLIAGTSTYLVLTVLGVPFAVPLAVLMAFLDLIPLVGATVGGVVIGIVAGVSDFPTALIVWAIFFIVYQQVENNVLQPFVYNRTVALHPLVVLVAVLIGGSQLGVLGALLAIPVAAAVQILVKDWWHFRQRPRAPTTPDPAGPPPTELGPGPGPSPEPEAA